MSRSPDPEDVRLRFGMDPPRLEEREYWASLEPGADEYQAAIRRLNPIVHYPRPEPCTDDADGEA